MNDMKKANNILSNKNKGNPFKVPEGYFDNFRSRLSERIHARETPGIYEKYILTLRPYLAIAALFIGVVIIGKIFYNVLYPESNIKELKTNEIAELINEDAYYLSEESIIEIIYMSDVEPEDEKTGDSEDNLTNEVIDYLINEEIDIIDIIDAL